MTQNIEQLYGQFEQRWELKNPRPTPPTSDMLLVALQVCVAIGAVLLSGSRTGNVVANIGSLTEFGVRLVDLIGLGQAFTALFVAAEAVLAFVTFDSAILLYGYLTSEKDGDARWYRVMFIAAIIPALAANVLPGVQLLGPKIAQTGLVVVDVLVGVCSPFMAFVAGRVIGLTRTQHRQAIQQQLEQWEARKGNAWTSSEEYRQRLNIKSEVKKEVGLSDRILSYLGSNGVVKLDELSKSLNVSTQELSREVLRLELSGSVQRSGDEVWATDY